MEVERANLAPAAPGGAPKHRTENVRLYGSRPQKPKNTAAATRRQEDAAKVAQFQKAPERLPMPSE